MDKNELKLLLNNEKIEISEIEIPKTGRFFLVFPDKETQKSFKFYLSFIPTNITIDGKDNHNQKVYADIIG